ncbi:HupE/UreJ family protein [Niveibacterium sp. 24ML]|uniref:HupE/UreJ family protein n=1 Tax=Niveibacterium sp. 24ML TaxID=2985512 RepID=UPI00226EA550|nr:HupE/UreJ family protein [Niveibacterium sp. 24ML]MCX9157467.1 HupE/UreJ family protein [Niveibacterium sp. 24ML]
MRPIRPLLAAGLVMASGTALAHPGHEVLSLASGLAHPFGGADHLLAMLAVGLYAARQGGAARWALPAAFVGAMLAAAALANAGMHLPLVEFGIATSVLVLGLMIAALVRLPLALSLPLVSVFALCHGAAHVAEKGSAGLLAYAVGFALASAALHGLGWLLGRQLPQSDLGKQVQRVAGGAIAIAGGVLLGA